MNAYIVWEVEEVFLYKLIFELRQKINVNALGYMDETKNV